jgi:hypothetical protein
MSIFGVRREYIFADYASNESLDSQLVVTVLKRLSGGNRDVRDKALSKEIAFRAWRK